MNYLLFEIRKISNKLLYSLLIIIWLVSCFIYPCYYVYHNKGNMKEINQLYKQYKDIDLTKERCQEIYDSNKTYPNIYNDLFEVYNAREYRRTGEIQELVFQELHEKQGEIISTNTIKQKLLELKKNNYTDIYEYINLEKQNEMMLKAGEPNIVYKKFWKIFDKNETITVFLFAFVVVFIISPIFSNEYKYKMYMLIDSSIYAKKKNVKYKIMLGYLLSISGVVIINLTMGFIYLILGSYNGYDVKLVNLNIDYAQTPYALSILSYTLLKIEYQCLALMVLVSFTTFVSMKSKSSLLALIIGISALCTGFFYIILNYSSKKIWSLMSITNGLDTQKVFSHYISFKVVNKPILYPFVLFFLYIMVICAFNVLISYIYNKRILNNKQ